MTKVTPHPMSGEDRAKSIVLVFRRKPRPLVYVRDYPESARNPSLAQIDVRLQFARLARRARGIRYRGLLIPGEIPPAAQMVARGLSGYRSPYSRGRRSMPKWIQKLYRLGLLSEASEELEEEQLVWHG